MRFETIIGLEIHVELSTKSKIFCSCSTSFGDVPNKNTCPICIGMPGTLPVLNEEAVILAIKAGKALNCHINPISKFDRKNYFYADLPKAYQITQFYLPICTKGHVDIIVKQDIKRIGITRIHLEEDAGKLIHLEEEGISLVDYNRAGIPLIEIVTEPDLKSPKEAVVFLKTLKSILQYAGISDCRMEEGSLRCDANISIRELGQRHLNPRVEIKNLNSFKDVLKALEEEEERQRQLYFKGEGSKIKQETKRWSAAKGKTLPLRSKEEANNYGYFPEPDLKPISINEEFIQNIIQTLPELPMERKKRFLQVYGIKEKLAEILIEEKELADFFEEVISYGVSPIDASNWITVDLLRVLKDRDIISEGIPIKADYLAKLIALVKEGKISHRTGREIFNEMIITSKSPEVIMQKKGLNQISDRNELDKIVKEIISQYPKAVDDYKNGKSKALGYIMGQVMKVTKGRANPQILKQIIIQQLEK